MKTFDVKITFENGKTQNKLEESNDKITAMNLALNRLDEKARGQVVNVEISDIDEKKKMTDEEYLAKAEEVFKENQKWEISRIARKLKKDDEEAELKKIQDNCPHEKTESYNHGYHTFCRDCGKELD